MSNNVLIKVVNWEIVDVLEGHGGVWDRKRRNNVLMLSIETTRSMVWIMGLMVGDSGSQ